MARKSVQKSVWALARRQHGVVTRWQLLELGFSDEAIDHRIRRGRLHRVHDGVYAVGRPELTRDGHWMAAVLACGPGAALSHSSAAALWSIRDSEGDQIEISVPANRAPRPRGIRVLRRATLIAKDVTRHRGIPVTTPVCTLIDLATRLTRNRLERAVDEADKLDLIDPERLRRELDGRPKRRGVKALRTLLDTATFVLTTTELERKFLPTARRAGLPKPETQVELNGSDVDFYFRELGLVIETDGLRYHRTAFQQTRDRVRDQIHTAAGLTPLRFTHAQVAFEPGYVEGMLRAVASRLAAQ
jgi:very-short-patch-repair endonuclease